MLTGAETETGDKIHQEENKAGSSKRVRETSGRVSKLVAQLDVVVFEPASGKAAVAVEMDDVVTRKMSVSDAQIGILPLNIRCEEAGQDVANDTTDRMYREDIQGIIDTDEELELRCVIAGSSADDTEYDGRPGRNVTRSRCDRNQTRNNPRAEADGGPLLFKSVIKDAPRDTTNGGGQIRDDRSHDRTHIRTESRPRVETEPTHPEEDGTDNDVCDVVRSEVELVRTVSTSLAEHQGVGQCSRPGSDVHRRSTGEIETTHHVNPSVRIPRPAGNRIVDDRRPNEHKDDAREHTTSLGDSPNRKCDTTILKMSAQVHAATFTQHPLT